MASFTVPTVSANADGWGPTTVPESLDGVPYAPFGKGDRIGRVSDFTAAGLRYGARFHNQREPGVAVFNFFANEDDDAYQLVDSRPVQRNRGGPKRFQPNRFQQNQRRLQEEAAAAANTKRQPRKQQQRRQFQQFQRNDQRQLVYTSSVDIRPEWAVKDQIPFTALAKLNSIVPEVTDLAFHGSLRFYDKSFDRVTPKFVRQLKATRAVHHDITVSDDPVIRKYVEAGTGQVFMTDTVLTTLMCSPRSVYSWDIVIRKEGDKLFFDTREGSLLSHSTVAETAPEGVAEDKDNINGVQQLRSEATSIGHAFSQQVLLMDTPPHECGEADPFEGIELPNGAHAASVAYRYRTADLGNDRALVVRCAVDGVMTMKGAEQMLAIKMLNEADPKLTGVDWRQKIENQRGAVLATELKNNANKLAQWTAGALVAGVDIIKLGYVSRVHPRDPTQHVILSTQAVKPPDFANQINLSMGNCWGIVRALVDTVAALEDGTWLLVKDPNKPLLRLYSVPADAFKEDYADEAMEIDDGNGLISAPDGADDDKDDE